MQTGFQEQVPTTKSKIQIISPCHLQWKLVQTGASHPTIFKLKEKATGPACPWLNGTWLSFMNPDLIYPCNTEFMTAFAGMFSWLDWISTVSICSSNLSASKEHCWYLRGNKDDKKYSGPFLMGNYFMLCFVQKGLTKVSPKKLLCLTHLAS